jgi:predicted transcriptional regulator of viral defense system
MVYTTSELLELGESEYSIRIKLKNGLLFKVSNGFYSDKKDYVIDEQYISKKYPSAVFTGYSAFYMRDMTDGIPPYYYLATEQKSFPIRRSDVKQSYQSKTIFNIGITVIEWNGVKIRTYNYERLLIELIRLKTKYPSDLYYEVLNSFRQMKSEIDFGLIQDYLLKFEDGTHILLKIKEAIA